MKLSELSVGTIGKIVEINTDKNTKLRLEGMGLTSDVNVKIIRFAPLGDPIEIELRGFHLAIRRTTAERIEIKEVESL